jgi:hypothetical protein
VKYLVAAMYRSMDRYFGPPRGSKPVLVVACVAAGIAIFADMFQKRSQGAVTSLLTDGRFVSDWIVTGPIESGADNGSKKGGARSFIRDSNVLNFPLALGKPVPEGPTKHRYRAETYLVSEKQQKMYLSVGSDDALAMEVDGKTVYTAGARKFFTLEDCVAVEVAEGTHRLVLTSDNVEEGSQRLRLHAGSSWTACVKAFLNDRQRVLQTCLPGLQNTITLAFPQPPNNKERFSLSIRTGATEVPGKLVGVRWTATDDLEDGIYTASITFDGETWSEQFYKGDSVAAARTLTQRLDAEREANDPTCEALIRRLGILIRPTSQNMSDKDWRRKMVFTLKEATDFVRYGSATSLGQGIHILGFKSEIDGSKQYYRLFVPSAIKEKKALPVAVLVPTATSATRPFIESVFISRQIEADLWGVLAEKLGLVIVWEGYRAQPNGYPYELEHFSEVMNDVERRVCVDKERLYLMATCRAGVMSAMIAEHWPNRFAAIGLVDPIFTRPTNRDGDDPTLFAFEAYRSWVSRNEPLRHVNALAHTRVFIVHDGTEPGHGSIHDARQFMGIASESGVETLLKEIPPSILHLRSWERVMSDLITQRRHRFDTEVAPHGRPTSAGGPVSLAFAGPFALVLPTHFASKVEADAATGLAVRLRNAWKKTHSVDCRVLLDSEVTESMDAQYNLVLIGNADVNAAWKNLNDEIPYRMRENYVTARGIKIDVKEGYGMAAISRGSHGRLIVIVGGPKLSEGMITNCELWIDGWFDLGIWDRSPTGSRLIRAEVFNENPVSATVVDRTQND